MIGIVALALGLSALLPHGIAPFVQQAYAGNTASLWKSGNIEYSSGSWNTHIFRANDGGGETYAYCIEPSKNSPDEGTYEKQPISTKDGREGELRADLWFSYGFPGFDKSIWPSTNWDGAPMSEEDYYLASHILLSDTYASSVYEATFGASESFREWIGWYVTGFGTNSPVPINESAVGRYALHHANEVPGDFEAYQIGGGARQHILTSAHYDPNGTMKMQKRSSNADITNGNPCYSLAGITYGIYTDPDCDGSTHGTGKALVLDASGYGEVPEIRMGTYYVREMESSLPGTGYAHDPTVYACTVKGNQTSWVHDGSNSAGDVSGNDVRDTPLSKDVGVLVQKYDVLTQSVTPSGRELMQDALFEVRYYANLAGDASGEQSRSWLFKTDASGRIDLRDNLRECFVSGDELYRDPETGEALFPLGTYAIREKEAPAGYEQPDDGPPLIFTITEHGMQEHDVSTGGVLEDGGISVVETPIRHDISFTKRDLGTQRPMGNIPFMISRYDEDGQLIEQHVGKTDANGRFDSSARHISHAYHANRYDATTTRRPNGTYEVDEGSLSKDGGTWFGVSRNGTWIEPDDEYGAFPDSPGSKIVFEELPVAANESMALVSFEVFAHAAESSNIDLGTVGNVTPSITTEAYDVKDGDKVVSLDTDAEIADTVSYAGLVSNRQYLIQGELMDKATGAPICTRDGSLVTSSMTFLAPATSGSVELHFSLDGCELEDGAQIVVFETISEGDRRIAEHASIDDGAQTVTAVRPRIRTLASDCRDGDKIVTGDVDALIVDAVSYSGLTPGAEYMLEGVVMDKESASPLVSSEEEVTSSVRFVPEGSSGTVCVDFSFDASDVPSGTRLVAFERLSRDGVPLASHEDIEDEMQTVTVFPPGLKTNAHDPADGDAVVSADAETVVVDTVSYDGLRPGCEYELRGILVNKENGRQLLDPFDRPVSAKTSFVPVESTGSVDVTFAFDATSIDAASTFVAFEELYRDGKRIASHIDLEDAGQAFIIEQPAIQTFASVDGSSKSVMRDREATIIDTVSFRNLKPGKTYELEGQLIDNASGSPLHDADGETVSARTVFTAEADTGSADVRFDFDATIVDEGSQLVVYESLLSDGVEIAAHEDIDDARQAVEVVRPEMTTQARSAYDTKDVVRDVEAMVVDKVEYKGLMPDREYVLEGTLMNKASGLPVCDVGGSPVQALERLVPSHADGTALLSFSFDASMLEDDAEIVVFERIARNGHVIAAHEDMSDEEQTVFIRPASIVTKASDPTDGDQSVNAHERTRVLDTVMYEGLRIGASYEFVGTLMDGQSHEPVLDSRGQVVRARKGFTTEQAQGTLDVSFSFDASHMTEEHQAVVFEELYRDGKLIASHADFDDGAQSVSLEPPRLKTYACDAEDGDKEIVPGRPATIIDSVDYSGLEPGRTYRMLGRLMIDDGTLEGAPALTVAGTPITAQATFTPDASHGSVEVAFEVDAGIMKDGTKLVAFETLMHEQVELATHEDIRDERQAVLVTSAPGIVLSKTNVPLTAAYAPTDAVYAGDADLLFVVMLGALSMLSLLGIIWLHYRVVPKERE